MKGAYYWDSLGPFNINVFASITLANTMKALHVTSAVPNLGNLFFNWAGQRIGLKGFGRMTTAATPGNVQMALFWGTGADANGTNIGQTTTQALSTTQTNMSFEFEFDILCTKINDSSANGALLAMGRVMAAEPLWAPHLLLPHQTPAPVTVDLSANNIISLQMLRSGSTAETAQLHDLYFYPKN